MFLVSTGTGNVSILVFKLLDLTCWVRELRCVRHFAYKRSVDYHDDVWEIISILHLYSKYSSVNENATARNVVFVQVLYFKYLCAILVNYFLSEIIFSDYLQSGDGFEMFQVWSRLNLYIYLVSPALFLLEIRTKTKENFDENWKHRRSLAGPGLLFILFQVVKSKLERENLSWAELSWAELRTEEQHKHKIRKQLKSHQWQSWCQPASVSMLHQDMLGFRTF